jgi:putative membrane protein
MLIFSPYKLSIPSYILPIFPLFNAVVNSITTLVLVAALIAIKNERIDIHRNLMLTAFGLGAVFLISYVIYHSSAPGTVFGDIDGNGQLSSSELESVSTSRAIYLFILLSHILLAIGVVPLVLLSLYFAWIQKFDKHRKIVKFAYPIWLYVSITGVIVYIMIQPYYSF